jgi:hypothetical protein
VTCRWSAPCSTRKNNSLENTFVSPEATRRWLTKSHPQHIRGRAELIEIGRLIGDSQLRPIIEAIFPLDRAREAFEHGAGKIVLQVTAEAAAAGKDTQVPGRAA